MDKADQQLMEAEEYNFAPRLNHRSNSKIKMTFEERQEMYKKKRESNRKKLYRSVDRYSHVPKINNNTEKLIKANKDRKEFYASTVQELKPDLGYNAIRRYVTA